jgi:hypothetical protein
VHRSHDTPHPTGNKSYDFLGNETGDHKDETDDDAGRDPDRNQASIHGEPVLTRPPGERMGLETEYAEQEAEGADGG